MYCLAVQKQGQGTTNRVSLAYTKLLKQLNIFVHNNLVKLHAWNWGNLKEKKFPFVQVPLVHSKIISFDLQMQIETILNALFSMYFRFWAGLKLDKVGQSSPIRTVPCLWCAVYHQTRQVKFINSNTALNIIFIPFWSAVTYATLDVVIRRCVSTSPLPSTQYLGKILTRQNFSNLGTTDSQCG